MPLVDLSTVTDALRTLISEGIAESGAWSPNPPPTVEPFAPEAMSAEGLTMYLFAVGENATAANRAGNVGDLALGLDLHYQLVAHGGGTPTRLTSQREQLLFGLALKVLHDHPRLQAGVTVNGIDVFGTVGMPDGNTMSITLRKLEPEQAITWWTASSSGIRAAAYYTVAVALIHELPPPVTGPPVLVREVFGFAGLAPHVTGSSARVVVTRPGASAATVGVSPAQVRPGDTFGVSGFGFGDRVNVLLRAEGWDGFEALAGARVHVENQQEVATTSIDPVVGGRLVVPGTARVRVVREEDRLLADGSTRTFTFESNDTAISVVPAIDAVTPGAPSVIDGGPFEGPGIDPASVRVMVGAVELTSTGAAPATGEFHVLDRNSIQFEPAAPVPSGAVERLRVFVNGAESLPTWYVAP